MLAADAGRSRNWRCLRGKPAPGIRNPAGEKAPYHGAGVDITPITPVLALIGRHFGRARQHNVDPELSDIQPALWGLAKTNGVSRPRGLQ